MKKKGYAKFLSPVLACAFALCFLCAAGCSGDNGPGGDSGKDNNPTGRTMSFEKALDSSVLGGIGLLNSPAFLSGAGAAGFKKDGGNTSSLPKASFMADSLKKGGDILTDAQKRDILTNLAIAEATINGGAVKSEMKKSDREGFAYMYTISAADMSGINRIYYFYYNETEKEPDVDDEDEKDADEDDFEKEISLEGIVILDGTEYRMTGERTIETGEAEVEFEVKTDADNAVVIKQETEGDETEFEYTLIKGGIEVYSSEVEYKVDEKGRVKLGFELETPEGKMEYEYKFTESGGNKFVKVEMEKNGQETETVIKVSFDAENKPVYEFIDTETENGEADGAGPNADDDAGADADADDDEDAGSGADGNAAAA